MGFVLSINPILSRSSGGVWEYSVLTFLSRKLEMNYKQNSKANVEKNNGRNFWICVLKIKRFKRQRILDEYGRNSGCMNPIKRNQPIIIGSSLFLVWFSLYQF